MKTPFKTRTPGGDADRQRGAATVAATLVLLVGMLLVVLFANRGLLLEARMSANQARSTVAFEAAEAGLEWALARLNDPGGIDDRCLAAPGASSFRARYTTPTPTPPRPACVRSGSGWSCSCPAGGAAALTPPAGDHIAPAFSLEIQAAGPSGPVRVVSTGCTSLGGACAAGSGTRTDASARVEVSVALLPALASAPAAVITARAGIDAGGAAIGLYTIDPASGGVLAHAGGAIQLPAARLSVAAGASLADTLAGHDASLAGLDGERLFAAYFGVSKRAWKGQPLARSLTCNDDCAAVLEQAIGADVANPLIWIEGDAAITGPLTLGRPDRPVVLVATGALQLHGPVALHGVVYANGVTWQGSGGSGLLRGALISEAGYAGDAAPDLHHDSTVLALLRRSTGSFVRVPGSWRDF